MIAGATMMTNGAAIITGGAALASGGIVATPETAGASLGISAVGVGAIATGATTSLSGAVMFMKGVKGAINDISFDGGNDSYSTSSNEAFRKAKDQNGIPRSQQPEKTIKPMTPEGDKYNLDKRNSILFIFKNSKNKTIHIRKDKPVKYDTGAQSPHYNAGEASGSKLKQHHYYGKD
jgi:hypothetical protein